MTPSLSFVAVILYPGTPGRRASFKDARPPETGSRKSALSQQSSLSNKSWSVWQKLRRLLRKPRKMPQNCGRAIRAFPL